MPNWDPSVFIRADIELFTISLWSAEKKITSPSFASVVDIISLIMLLSKNFFIGEVIPFSISSIFSHLIYAKPFALNFLTMLVKSSISFLDNDIPFGTLKAVIRESGFSKWSENTLIWWIWREIT